MSIIVKNLTKVYGKQKALNDVSLSIEDGEIVGLLGPNGAGKSTMMKILTCFIPPTSGDVKVCGYDIFDNPMEVRRSIGYLPEQNPLYYDMYVREFLLFVAGIHRIEKKLRGERVEEIIELTGLSKEVNKKIAALSKGYKQRVGIAQALIHEPEVLILDEPTTGLDPQTRQLLWSVITKLRKTEGLTVFLTTHYMEESADSDYVVILDAGQISAEGTPLELKNKYTGDFITLYGESASLAERLNLPSEKLNGAVRIAVPNSEKAAELIIKNPDVFKDYEIIKGKMDDVFLAVTGKNLSGGR